MATGAVMAVTAAASAYSAYSASETAENELDAAKAMSATRMAFSQGMLDDWEETFGGLEENLGEYYNNLDPTKFSAQNKSTYRDSMNKQMTQFNETMASKGLMTSGQSAQVAQEQAFAMAQGNAQIDLAAEETVRGQQLEWMKYGSTDKANAISAYTGAQANSQQMSMTAANMYGQSSAGYASAAGSALGMAANAYSNYGGAMSAGLSGGASANSMYDYNPDSYGSGTLTYNAGGGVGLQR